MKVKVLGKVYTVSEVVEALAKAYGVDGDMMAKVILSGQIKGHLPKVTYTKVEREPDGVVIYELSVDEDALVIISLKVDFD